MERPKEHDWKLEAQKQAASAGELRIGIAVLIDEYRARSEGIRKMLETEDNHLDQVILQFKLQTYQGIEKELEQVLNGGGNA